jgi:hypothetical protein
MSKQFQILVGVALAALVCGVFFWHEESGTVTGRNPSIGAVVIPEGSTATSLPGWAEYSDPWVGVSISYPTGTRIYGPTAEPNDWRVDLELAHGIQSADVAIIKPYHPIAFSMPRLTTATAEQAHWSNWSETTTTIDGREFVEDIYSDYIAGLQATTRNIDLIELNGALTISFGVLPYSSSTADQGYLGLFSRMISTLKFTE